MKEENMQIPINTVTPIPSTANLILNAGFDDAPIPTPTKTSRPKKMVSAVL